MYLADSVLIPYLYSNNETLLLQLEGRKHASSLILLPKELVLLEECKKGKASIKSDRKHPLRPQCSVSPSQYSK